MRGFEQTSESGIDIEGGEYVDPLDAISLLGLRIHKWLFTSKIMVPVKSTKVRFKIAK